MKATRFLFAALLVIASCDDPGDTGFSVESTAEIAGVIVLDANGSRTVDSSDPALPGVRLELRLANTGALAATTVTAAGGIFRFREVPVGEYRLGLVDGALGDTLELLNFTRDPFTLEAADSLVFGLSLTYPTATIEEARALPPGRKIFTSGIALNPREPFGDGVVHLQGDSLYLRATDVARGSLNVGDSVRFLGRTGRSAGQPVLQDVTPFILVSQAAVPRRPTVTARDASSAGGGRLDAALVRLQTAEIADTATDAAGDYLVTARDGTGSVVVVFRSIFPVSRTFLNPDSVIFTSVTGLLRPAVSGEGVQWRLYPRFPDDVAAQRKPR
jgi:hypothetical protein